MFTFAHIWILLLLPLPWLAIRLFKAHREQRRAVYVPFMQKLAELSGNKPESGAVIIKPVRVQRWLIPLFWVLTLTALARPQWIEKPIVKEIPMRDMLLAVDLSGSMEEADFVNADGLRVTRLAAVKEVLGEFLEERDGDRVGLIFFGTAPFVQAPFTEDLSVIQELLNEAQVRMAGPKTMLGDAVGLAIHVFANSELDDRVVILLTDGNDTGSSMPPVEAAKVAADRGITLHVVAMGDPSTVGESAIDEGTLQQMAETTGGRYYHGSDRIELEGIYDELNRLETRVVETVGYRPRKDLFIWPIAALLLIWMSFHIVMLIRERSSRTGPGERPAQSGPQSRSSPVEGAAR
jgi:Ca-activated chloride channel family protein